MLYKTEKKNNCKTNCIPFIKDYFSLFFVCLLQQLLLLATCSHFFFSLLVAFVSQASSSSSSSLQKVHHVASKQICLTIMFPVLNILTCFYRLFVVFRVFFFISLILFFVAFCRCNHQAWDLFRKFFFWFFFKGRSERK